MGSSKPGDDRVRYGHSKDLSRGRKVMFPTAYKTKPDPLLPALPSPGGWALAQPEWGTLHSTLLFRPPLAAHPYTSTHHTETPQSVSHLSLPAHWETAVEGRMGGMVNPPWLLINQSPPTPPCNKVPKLLRVGFFCLASRLAGTVFQRVPMKAHLPFLVSGIPL